MDIRVYTHARMSHQSTWAQAFADGLARHGIQVQVEERSNFQPCDLAVFWSHRPADVIQTQRARSADYLVMERGYLGDRFAHTSLRFNGLNGHGDCPHATGHRRAEQWQHLLQPWRSTGSYYLLAGQVPGDMSLADCPDYTAWLRSIPLEIFGKPVKFRGHPKAPHVSTPHQQLPADQTLAQQLQQACGLIAWNSNSTVESILAGVPTVAYSHGSMAWELAGHSLEEMGAYYGADRADWLNDLAFSQWTKDEIASGLAWEHLRRRYH